MTLHQHPQAVGEPLETDAPFPGGRFLPGRRRQVAAAGAGVLMNLALLLPVYLVWALLAESARARPALGGLLLIGAGAGLVNILPLPPLDGYKILEYLLGTAGLSGESRRFAVLAAGRLIRRGPGVGAYPARARLVHGGYALGWTVLTGLLLLALGVLCRHLLPARFAAPATALPALAVGGVLAFRAFGNRRPARPGPVRAERAGKG